MDELATTYATTLWAIAALAGLLLIQIVVADVVGLRRKHTPGSPVDANHDDLLFRAARTVANTNESLAVAILALLYCLLSGASPELTGLAAWAFVGSRLAYAICYYADLRVLRSVCFGVSLLALAGLIAVGVLT